MRIKLLFLVVSVLVFEIIATNSYAEVIREDINYDNVSLVQVPTDNSTYLMVDIELPNILDGMHINASYLYIEINAERVLNSEHGDELLCIGISPITGTGEIDMENPTFEYRIEPGYDRTVSFDITEVIRYWEVNDVSSSQFAVFGSDPYNESYFIQVTEGHDAAGWLEYRYVDMSKFDRYD